MIRSLFLQSFGKFQSQKFSLSPLSLFLGKNESGKSTIFDALLYHIAKPKGNHTEGKRIQARYGDSKSVEVEGDFPTEQDIDEFLNLHCLKSGEIRIDFSKDRWVENIKKQLFSGGIDPNSIAKELEKLSSSSGTTKKNRNIQSLKKSIADTEVSINSTISEKNSLLSHEDEIRDQEKKKEELSFLVKKLEERLTSLEKDKQEEDRIRERRKLRNLYQSLVQRIDLLNRLQNLEKVSESSVSKLLDIEKTKFGTQEREKINSHSRTILIEKINQLSKSIRTREESFTSQFNRENLARNLRERIEENILNPFTKEETQRDNNLFLGSIASFIIGAILMGLSAFENQVLMVLGGVFLLLSPVIFYLSSKRRLVYDSERNHDALLRYKREWAELESGEDLNSYTSFQSLRDFFYQYIAQRKQESDSIQASKKELNMLEEELSSLEQDKISLQSERESLEKKEQEILSSLNLSGRENAESQLLEKRTLQETLKNLEIRIKSEYNDPDWDLLKLETERKLSTMDQENLRENPLEESAYLQLQNNIRNVSMEWKAASEELKQVELKNVESKTGVEARLGPLSMTLMTLEKNLLEKKELLEREEQNLQAIIACKEIFEILTNESNDSLESLSQEIQNSTGSIFTGNRGIRIQDLKGKIEMEDAGGSYRSLDHLSLGTRDCFYIAAKLALCEKNNPELKVFLMDEPFASLDSERTSLLIRLIRYYTENKGWQIIVFSKDFRLKELFLSESANTTIVHELSES